MHFWKFKDSWNFIETSVIFYKFLDFWFWKPVSCDVAWPDRTGFQHELCRSFLGAQKHVLTVCPRHVSDRKRKLHGNNRLLRNLFPSFLDIVWRLEIVDEIVGIVFEILTYSMNSGWSIAPNILVVYFLCTTVYYLFSMVYYYY